MVFNEIWNHLKAKAARRINSLVSEVITLLSLSIHCSFLSFLQIDRYPPLRIHDPVHSINVPSTCMHLNLQRFHLALLVVTFSFDDILLPPAFPMFQQLSPPCFHDRFIRIFSTSVSIIRLCATAPAYQPNTDDIASRFFSDPSQSALVTRSSDPCQHKTAPHGQTLRHFFYSFLLISIAKPNHSVSHLLRVLSLCLYSLIHTRLMYDDFPSLAHAQRRDHVIGSGAFDSPRTPLARS